jgi:ureidoglycolate lyase
MNRIKLVPIDDEAFAPFGAVLAPHADGVRRDHFELLVNKRASARANLASVRADRRGGDAGMTVRTLERHPDSSQTFFPLTARRYLVVVCGTTEEGWPDTSRLLAFSVPGSVGIHYFPGTWHLGIGVLEGDGDFLMIVHEDGTPRDCEFRDIEPVEISFRS